MEKLTKIEKEFIALGASIGSNCIPCITYHIEKSKKVNIPLNKIQEAIEFAKTIKEVPAKLVYDTALKRLDPENTKKNNFTENSFPCCDC